MNGIKKSHREKTHTHTPRVNFNKSHLHKSSYSKCTSFCVPNSSISISGNGRTKEAVAFLCITTEDDTDFPD